MEIDYQDPATSSEIEESFSALSLNSSLIDLTHLQNSITQLFSGFPGEELIGVISIRKILSIPANPPIQEVIDTGIVPNLIKMSYQRPVKFAYEVCWILCNIGSGDSQHTRYLVELGVLEFFSDILKSNLDSNELKDQIVWAVGNISGDCIEFRNLVNNSKIFHQVLNHSYEILTNNHEKFIANCMWALANFVRGKPLAHSSVIKVVNKCLLKALIFVNDSDVLIDISLGLSYTAASKEILSNIKEKHLIRLLNLVNWQEVKLLKLAIRIIGNFISIASDSWELLKPLGMLETLLKLLSHPKMSVRKDIYWALSNLCSESNEVVCYLLNLGGYNTFLENIESEDSNVIGEIIWVVSNSFDSADCDSIKALFEIGWFHKLLELLRKKVDLKQKTVIIKVIKIIFKKCPDLLDCKLKEEIRKISNFAS